MRSRPSIPSKARSVVRMASMPRLIARAAKTASRASSPSWFSRGLYTAACHWAREGATRRAWRPFARLPPRQGGHPCGAPSGGRAPEGDPRWPRPAGRRLPPGGRSRGTALCSDARCRGRRRRSRCRTGSASRARPLAHRSVANLPLLILPVGLRALSRRRRHRQQLSAGTFALLVSPDARELMVDRAPNELPDRRADPIGFPREPLIALVVDQYWRRRFNMCRP